MQLKKERISLHSFVVDNTAAANVITMSKESSGGYAFVTGTGDDDLGVRYVLFNVRDRLVSGDFNRHYEIVWEKRQLLLLLIALVHKLVCWLQQQP